MTELKDRTGNPLAVGVTEGSYVEIRRVSAMTGKEQIFRGVAAEAPQDPKGTYLVVKEVSIKVDKVTGLKSLELTGKTRSARLEDVEVLRKSKDMREAQAALAARSERVAARQVTKGPRRRARRK